MGRERNVGREIAFSLLAAVVLGTAFYFYLVHSIDAPGAPPSAQSNAGPAPNATPIPRELLNARTVVEPFAAALAGKRYEEAYALMAAPYRASTSLEAFTQTCQRSPLLSTVQRGAVFSTTRTMLGTGTPGPYSERARGLLITAAGSIDANFTLLVDAGNMRILVLVLAGVPVLDGVSAR